MPTIPILKTPSINTNAPDLNAGPNMRAASAVSDAVANVGSQLQNFGENLYAKRKQAETINFRSQAMSDFERESADMKSRLQTEFADDPTGLTDSYRNWQTAWKEDRQRSAPSDDARSGFQNDFDQPAAVKLNQVNAFEEQRKVYGYKTEMEKSSFASRQQIAKNPNSAEATMAWARQRAAIEGNIGYVYTKDEADLEMMKQGTEYAESLFDGLKSNKQYAAGLRAIDGKDKSAAELVKYMDPNRINHFREQFKNGMERDQLLNKSVFNGRMDDVVTTLATGAADLSNPQVKAAVTNLRTQALALPPAERAEALDNLNSAVKISDGLATLQSLPLDKARTMVGAKIVGAAPGEDPTFNASKRSVLQAQYQKQANELVKNWSEDPNTFYLKTDTQAQNLMQQALNTNDPDAMGEYRDYMIGRQKADGLAPSGVLTKPMIDNWKVQLMSNNSDASDNVAQGIKQVFGPSAFAEIAQSDEKFRPYAVAYAMVDEQARKDTLTHIREAESINANYKNLTDRVTGEDKSVMGDPAIQGVLGAMALTDPSGQKSWMREGVQKAVELEYKFQRTNGMNDKDARRTAVDKVITKNWDTATMRNSAVLVPKSMPKGTTEQVEEFIQNTGYSESFAKLGAAPSAVYANNLAEKADDKVLARYHSDLANTAVWVSNPTNDGMMLGKKNAAGGIEPVRNAKGAIISLKFSELSSRMKDLAVKPDTASRRPSGQGRMF